jgi:hypothetical protein
MYQLAVTRLIRAADQVAEYRGDLAEFADTLAGKGWGGQVTGPIHDMDTRLVSLEGIYRDLAAQMKRQGDDGAAAYDQAPWVPGPEVVRGPQGLDQLSTFPTAERHPMATEIPAHLSTRAQGIVGLYEGLAPYRCGSVRLSAIRRHLPSSVDRAEVDAALVELADTDGVHLRAVVNQQTLTDADRDAAVRLGGEDRHALQIEWVDIED